MLEDFFVMNKFVSITSPKLASHMYRVGMYASTLAAFSGFTDEEVSHLKYACLFYDIGMTVLPDHIEYKPGKLTDDERTIMQDHTNIGMSIFTEATNSALKMASTIAHCHHEKWDGTGYPNGLQGEDIPIQARIVAVVDVFDALMSDKDYRQAFSLEETLSKMKQMRQTHLDPTFVDLFFENLDIFLELKESMSNVITAYNGITNTPANPAQSDEIDSMGMTMAELIEWYR
jgi:response regulator RpfG family c-di-GMP phosphodiesterase